MNTASSTNDQWTELTFSEAVQVNPGVGLKHGEVYPFVDMASVDGGQRTVNDIEEREFKGSGSKFQNGDTLMARITPCLENGKIARYKPLGDQQQAHGSTEFIVLRGRPGTTTDDFAYYLTRWEEVRQYAIGQMTGTSGRQRVPVDSLDHLTIPIPPLPGQRAIAHFLGTLDDKIELNRRMNQTLEAMARAIFQDWFVDFGPVRAKIEGQDPYLPPELWDLFADDLVDSELGEIPEGWEVRALDDIADYQNGLALQRFRPGDNEERLPAVKIAQLRTGKADAGEWARATIRPECIIDNGDVIFSWSGSLMVKVWSGGRAALNQHLFKVTSKGYPRWFYLQQIESHLSDFQSIAADKTTTMGHIKREHLSSAKCVVPGQTFLKAADEILGPLFTKQISVNLCSNALESQRDTLLPKLISGEIEVG